MHKLTVKRLMLLATFALITITSYSQDAKKKDTFLSG